MICPGMGWPDAFFFSVLTLCATWALWRFARWCVGSEPWL